MAEQEQQRLLWPEGDEDPFEEPKVPQAVPAAQAPIPAPAGREELVVTVAFCPTDKDFRVLAGVQGPDGTVVRSVTPLEQLVLLQRGVALLEREIWGARL